jgi:hypothetical protein
MAVNAIWNILSNEQEHATIREALQTIVGLVLLQCVPCDVSSTRSERIMLTIDGPSLAGVPVKAACRCEDDIACVKDICLLWKHEKIQLQQQARAVWIPESAFLHLHSSVRGC